jgi:hypothetical protein
MLHSRLALFLVAASLATASASADPIAEHHGGNPTAVTGVYSVTFNLNIQSTLPANSTILCKAQIAPGASFFSNINAQAIPVESAAGVAAITGSTAVCTVEIPFSWTVESTRNGAALSYQIDAVNATVTLPAVVRTSIQQGIAEPYPSSGATSSISLNITF